MLVYDKVTLTEFKPVWPASGRDFCNVAVTVEMSDGLFCQAYEAVNVAFKILRLLVLAF